MTTTMKTLLATTATLAILSMEPAWAQSATEPQVDEPLVEETTPGAAMPADQVPETVAQEAAAPQVGQPQSGAASFLAEQQEGHWLTSNLIGRNVLTPDGDTIGQVAALEIGPEGQVTSLVMTVGGFLGLGARQVAVPFEVVEHITGEPGDHQLILATTAEEIEAAPDFKTLVQKRQEEEAVRAQREMGADRPMTVDPANPPSTAQ